MDEPTSYLALGGVALLYLKDAVNKWLELRGRRNGRGPMPMIIARLDHIDEVLVDAKGDSTKLWEKVSGVSDRCARIEGRLEGGAGS